MPDRWSTQQDNIQYITLARCPDLAKFPNISNNRSNTRISALPDVEDRDVKSACQGIHNVPSQEACSSSDQTLFHAHNIKDRRNTSSEVQASLSLFFLSIASNSSAVGGLLFSGGYMT